MNEKIKKLKEIIDGTDNLVFFGGAGVSTESGIPDFRSTDGLYSQKYDFPPETIVSHTFFMKRNKDFFDFYKDKMMALDAKPNAAHYKLAEWEAQGKCRAVVTQNIDGLHQKAGSRNVMELHGSILRNICQKCGKMVGMEEFIRLCRPIPYCPDCGGVLKPDVVLYEEPLDSNTIDDAIYEISRADMLIIGGTSLVVYPAAGFVNYFRGDALVMINKDATNQDGRCDLVFRESVGQVLEEGVRLLKDSME